MAVRHVLLFHLRTVVGKASCMAPPVTTAEASIDKSPMEEPSHPVPTEVCLESNQYFFRYTLRIMLGCLSVLEPFVVFSSIIKNLRVDDDYVYPLPMRACGPKLMLDQLIFKISRGKTHSSMLINMELKHGTAPSSTVNCCWNCILARHLQSPCVCHECLFRRLLRGVPEPEEMWE